MLTPTPISKSAWHLYWFPIHEHVSWKKQRTDDICQFSQCESQSIHDNDHAILLVLTEFLCYTCTDVSCTIWWNIYCIYYTFHIMYFKQLVQNTEVLIRNNFNNKATTHFFSSHSMVKIATVGMSTGPKWQPRDTSDPSDHCHMLYGNFLALTIFPRFGGLSSCGKYSYKGTSH